VINTYAVDGDPSSDPAVMREATIAEAMKALDQAMGRTPRDQAFVAIVAFNLTSGAPNVTLNADRFAAWTDDGIRAVMLAHLRHCPEIELHNTRMHAEVINQQIAVFAKEGD
jgi:hypothetical protein